MQNICLNHDRGGNSYHCLFLIGKRFSMSVTEKLWGRKLPGVAKIRGVSLQWFALGCCSHDQRKAVSPDGVNILDFINCQSQKICNNYRGQMELNHQSMSLKDSSIP